MKRWKSFLVLVVIGCSLFVLGCSEIRPLQKGEALSCPSCGENARVGHEVTTMEKQQI